ncbi:TAP42-like protein [Neoconidiobolus thromboides FSU 785]|nr:TAP42-like protein [Neoconidiobolus thromboides FSU 785]
MSKIEGTLSSLDKGLSLKELIIIVEKDYQLLEEGEISSNEDKYKNIVIDNINRLRLLERAISEFNLYSTNENIEEINPSYLNFFLVNYYQGYFYNKSHFQNERKELLNQSKVFYFEFLSLLKNFNLVDNKAYQKLKEGKDVFTSLTREEKIKKYKEERETKQKMKELNEMAQLNEELQEEQEDLIREYSLSKIKYFGNKATEDLRFLQQELQLLSEQKDKIDDEVEVDLSWRLDNLSSLTNQNNKNLLDKNGKPLRPFVITSKQQEIRDGVFRPGHNLPTMTVDEYLQLEMERGNFLSGGGGERPEKKEVDDRDYEALDAETEKQREWDEFKDNNPRGSGNRFNKG